MKSTTSCLPISGFKKRGGRGRRDNSERGVKQLLVHNVRCCCMLLLTLLALQLLLYKKLAVLLQVLKLNIVLKVVLLRIQGKRRKIRIA